LKAARSISVEDFEAATMAWIKLRNERAAAERRLGILVGRPIGAIAEPRDDEQK
jgi:hypothetical protein